MVNINKGGIGKTFTQNGNPKKQKKGEKRL